MYTVKQYVEIFHLLFISHLEKKLDKKLYALKGGCNLRFYFKSIRYSEDIDFDIHQIAKDTLQNKIDKILDSQALKQNLQSMALEIIQITKPKQTETTQRWKISLKAEPLAITLPTKIEFSIRNMDTSVLFDPVDPNLIRTYSLYPILTNHYDLQTAFEQKTQALIHRTETQARDIFDLKLLIDQGAKPEKLSKKVIEKLRLAIDNALSISFGEFKSQVVAYLMNDYQSYYDSELIWNKIQEEIISTLERVLV